MNDPVENAVMDCFSFLSACMQGYMVAVLSSPFKATSILSQVYPVLDPQPTVSSYLQNRSIFGVLQGAEAFAMIYAMQPYLETKVENGLFKVIQSNNSYDEDGSRKEGGFEWAARDWLRTTLRDVTVRAILHPYEVAGVRCVADTGRISTGLDAIVMATWSASEKGWGHVYAGLVPSLAHAATVTTLNKLLRPLVLKVLAPIMFDPNQPLSMSFGLAVDSLQFVTVQTLARPIHTVALQMMVIDTPFGSGPLVQNDWIGLRHATALAARDGYYALFAGLPSLFACQAVLESIDFSIGNILLHVLPA